MGGEGGPAKFLQVVMDPSQASHEASEAMAQVKRAFISNLELGLSTLSKSFNKASGKPSRRSGELNLHSSSQHEKKLEKIKSHILQRIDKYFPTLEEFVCQRLLAAPPLLEEAYEAELRNGFVQEDEAALIEQIEKEIDAVDAEIIEVKNRIEAILVQKRLLNDYSTFLIFCR